MEQFDQRLANFLRPQSVQFMQYVHSITNPMRTGDLTENQLFTLRLCYSRAFPSIESLLNIIDNHSADIGIPENYPQLDKIEIINVLTSYILKVLDQRFSSLDISFPITNTYFHDIFEYRPFIHTHGFPNYQPELINLYYTIETDFTPEQIAEAYNIQDGNNLNQAVTQLFAGNEFPLEYFIQRFVDPYIHMLNDELIVDDDDDNPQNGMAIKTNKKRLSQETMMKVKLRTMNL